MTPFFIAAMILSLVSGLELRLVTRDANTLFFLRARGMEREVTGGGSGGALGITDVISMDGELPVEASTLTNSALVGDKYQE